MSTDYYHDVLGVAHDASPLEIEQAYRQLALKYHPDRNRSDSDAMLRFKQVQDAYEILLQPERRKPVGGFHTHASAFLAVKCHRDAIRRDRIPSSNNFVPALIGMATAFWLLVLFLCGLITGISSGESSGPGVGQEDFIGSGTVITVTILLATVLYVVAVVVIISAWRPR